MCYFNGKVMKNILYLLLLLLVSCQSKNVDIYSSYKEMNIENLQKPYVTSGYRMYCIGFQDGSFPNIGGHVPGEMGGIWTQPIKILDKFWVSVRNLDNNQSIDTIKATSFTTYPHMVKMFFPLEKYNADIICSLFVPMDKRAIQVNYQLNNRGNNTLNLEFEFAGKIDLRSGFFSEQKGIINYKDSLWIDSSKDIVVAKDVENEWYVVVSSDAEKCKYNLGKSKNKERLNYNLNNVPNIDDNTFIHKNVVSDKEEYNPIFKITNELLIPAQNSISQSYFLSGSDKSLEEAISENVKLRDNIGSLLNEKISRYKSINKLSNISIPDKKLEKVYNWVRFNTEWLFLEVPEIGKGYGAGFSHFIWWFGTDNSYSLQGILATGNFENAKSTLKLLKEQSELFNKNGRVIHEVVPSGAIVNPGNTQETAHFITSVWNTYLWTGDQEFLEEFYPFVKKGLNWLMNEKDLNGNLFPEGYGIMEIKDLNTELIDVAVYTQQALECGAFMAEVCNEHELYNKYRDLSVKLKNKINKEFWDERNCLYCDFYGTAKDAVKVADGAIEQFGNNIEMKNYYNQEKDYFLSFDPDYQHGWLINKNWVINTPLEVGIVPKDRAIKVLERMEENDMTSQWGPYLSAVNKMSNMTISTGVQAVSEAKYRRIDRALIHVNQIANTFNMVMPGSISEIMPYYGCFCQEWTIYGIAVPLIQYVFGVEPNAPKKEIVLKPQIPTGWDNLCLSNQRIGDTYFDVNILSNAEGTKYQIKVLDSDWNVKLYLPYHKGFVYKKNGKEISDLDMEGDFVVVSAKSDLEVFISSFV